MSHDELIDKAKEHAEVFERGGGFGVSINQFPLSVVREAVIIYFRNENRADRIEITLDKTSGDFIGYCYIPGT